jgi:hypothetical protein
MGSNKASVMHKTMWGRLTKDKHSNLLDPIVGYEEKEVWVLDRASIHKPFSKGSLVNMDQIGRGCASVRQNWDIEKIARKFTRQKFSRQKFSRQNLWDVWGSNWGIRSWYHIHNTSFSSELTNLPNKLECFITLI